MSNALSSDASESESKLSTEFGLGICANDTARVARAMPGLAKSEYLRDYFDKIFRPHVSITNQRLLWKEACRVWSDYVQSNLKGLTAYIIEYGPLDVAMEVYVDWEIKKAQGQVPNYVSPYAPSMAPMPVENSSATSGRGRSRSRLRSRSRSISPSRSPSRHRSRSRSRSHSRTSVK